MFGGKCPQCGKKVKKDFEFCPFCGINLNRESDYGFLGRKDVGEDIKLPFGFNTIFKSLTKELAKQMNELDKEIKQDAKKSSGKPALNPNTSFSIHIGMPGQKPIHINNKNMKLKQSSVPRKNLKLPKINDDVLKKIKKLEKKEPETNVRRLADRVVYEIAIPGVKSLNEININKLEQGVEIKAFSNKDLFVKNIDVNLPLINFYFEDESLVLEFALK